MLFRSTRLQCNLKGARGVEDIPADSQRCPYRQHNAGDQREEHDNPGYGFAFFLYHFIDLTSLGSYEVPISDLKVLDIEVVAFFTGGCPLEF